LKLERHVIFVDALLAYAQGAAFAAIGFESNRCVKFLCSHLADCYRKLDFFEIRYLAHAIEER